jgi:hypothetical protein
MAMEPTQSRHEVLGRARAGAVDRADGEAPDRPRDSDRLITRRAAIGGGLVGLGGLLLFPGLSLARAAVPNDPFVIVLKGLFQPVVRGPHLGLSSVDLSDGSYSTVPIYPVSGVPGNTDLNKAIGDFYVQMAGELCAYHIPGGSFAMQFVGGDAGITYTPDDSGGLLLTGTWELTILEATGIYRPFVGGHNQMVDELYLLPPGDGSGGADERACYCHIRRP